MRFYDPQSGSITVDGKEISGLTRSSPAEGLYDGSSRYLVIYWDYL